MIVVYRTWKSQFELPERGAAIRVLRLKSRPRSTASSDASGVPVESHYYPSLKAEILGRVKCASGEVNGAANSESARCMDQMPGGVIAWSLRDKAPTLMAGQGWSVLYSSK